MRAVFLLAFVACAFALEGKVLCGLCESLIGTLDKLDGHRVKEYVETLCAKASGFVATLCSKVADFGIDKLIELLHDKVEPTVICEKLHMC